MASLQPETVRSSRTCPACGSEDAQALWCLGDRLLHTTDEVFELWHCVGCTLRFLDPMPTPEQLAAYYPSGYWVGPSGAQSDGLRRRAADLYRRVVLRDHLRFIRRVLDEHRQAGKPTLRILDVGCGDGSFLDALDHRPCRGLDVSAEAVLACAERGIDALQGRLQDRLFGDERFDVVTMFHFLEHVEPREGTLEAVRDLLMPGGELVVQVPNVESFQSKLLGRFWSGYDVPRHLVDYSPRTLGAALERAGFEVIRISHFNVRDNPTTLANSIAPGLYPPARQVRHPSAPEWQAWLGSLGYLGLTLASLPFAILESACGHGASVMMQARALA